eukprot:314072-Prorocentrum_minimum.AAC.5
MSNSTDVGAPGGTVSQSVSQPVSPGRYSPTDVGAPGGTVSQSVSPESQSVQKSTLRAVDVELNQRRPLEEQSVSQSVSQSRKVLSEPLMSSSTDVGAPGGTPDGKNRLSQSVIQSVSPVSPVSQSVQSLMSRLAAEAWGPAAIHKLPGLYDHAPPVPDIAPFINNSDVGEVEHGRKVREVLDFQTSPSTTI